MRNSEQLREESKSARELLTRVTRLEDLDRALIAKKLMTLEMDGLSGAIPVSQAILQQAVIQYANSERAALRALGVEVSRDDYYPYVTYSGKASSTLGPKVTEVEFPSGLVPAVSESLSEVKGENGSWTLRKDGTLIMTVSNGRSSDTFATVNGVTYLNQAEFDKQFLDLSTLHTGEMVELHSVQEVRVDKHNSLVARVTHLESALQSLQVMVASPEESHWNKPEDLPPVGCDLLIKVPAGNDVFTVETKKKKVVYTTEVERIFKVFRTSHLADRAGDMEYRLPDNCTVTGRFAWTYP